MEATCQCGSGLPFARCHGDPRNEFAREQALREAEAVPSMFPFVRVHGIDEFLERAAHEGDAEKAANNALARIPADEWRRVVDSWAAPYADRWESITATAADVAAAERALVRGAVVAAISERWIAPRGLVELLEDPRAAPSLYPALALMLPVTAVWSIDEARAAAAAAHARRSPIERMDAVQEVAFALMTFVHVRRTRALAARLAAELPVDDLPNASRLLQLACDDVEKKLDAARMTAAALLISYGEQLQAAESAHAG